MYQNEEQEVRGTTTVIQTKIEEEILSGEMIPRLERLTCADVEEKIWQELLNGVVTLSKKKPFKAKLKQEIVIEEDTKMEAEQRIRQEKEAVLDKLKLLYEEERNAVLLRKSIVKRSASQMGKWKENLQDHVGRKILLQKKLFDAQSQIKREKKQLKIQEKLKEEEERIRIVEEKRKEEVRRKSEMNLNKMQRRRQLAKQFLKQVRESEKNIKKHKYPHLVNTVREQEQKRKEENQRNEILNEIKRKASVNLTEYIKEHMQKYQKINQQKDQKLKALSVVHNQKDSDEDSDENDSRNSVRQNKLKKKKYEQTSFGKRARETLQKAKTEHIMRYQESMQARNKIKEYQTYVKQHFIPTVQPLVPLPEQLEPKHLSFEQQRQKGIQYLNSVKKIIQKQQKNRSMNPQKGQKNEKQQGIVKKNTQKIQYKNYLKQLPKREPQDLHEQLKRSGDLNEGKTIVEMIQARSRKTKDAALIQTVRNKMALLSMFANDNNN